VVLHSGEGIEALHEWLPRWYGLRHGHRDHAKEQQMIVCQLSTLMGARRMTQSRLAALTGIHRDTIRKLYYNGWTSIRRDTLDRLCTVLGVQVGELLVWRPEERP
jgi:putative transcriptional regulator